MTMISYAQNAEDVLLHRVFGEQSTGFYVDVGANDPTVGSVTKHFYDRGWRGINCEPGQVFGKLQQARPRDTCLRLAVSNRDGAQTFFEFPAKAGLSTVDPDWAAHQRQAGESCREHQVPVRTLASICHEHVHGPIDFLTIDVENHEREVLEGGDWLRFRPRVILVEANRPENWEPILLQANYLFACFDGVNRFYVRGEESLLLDPLRAPANCTDDYIPILFLRQYAEGGQLFLEAVEEGVGPRAFRVGINLARLLHRMAIRFPRLARQLRQADSINP